MNKPTIISLSGKAQNGKTLSASILYDTLTANKKRCLKISYGNYVKTIAKEYYNWNGKKDHAGRTLLQQIGQEFRAKNPNFWVHTVVRLVDIIGKNYDYILIDDARFPNEVYCWQNNQYKVITIRVNRPNYKSTLTEDQQNDISETAMDEFDYAYNFDVYDKFQLNNRLTEVYNDL